MGGRVWIAADHTMQLAGVDLDVRTALALRPSNLSRQFLAEAIWVHRDSRRAQTRP